MSTTEPVHVLVRDERQPPQTEAYDNFPGIFCFRPGHETYPVDRQPEVIQVLASACRRLGSEAAQQPFFGQPPEFHVAREESTETCVTKAIVQQATALCPSIKSELFRCVAVCCA